MGNILCASLISDQVARSRHNGGLPTKGVIPPNDNLYTTDTDLRGDHVGELLCCDAFFDHGHVPNGKARAAIKPRKSKEYVKKYG
jgi:hypothetical protein